MTSAATNGTNLCIAHLRWDKKSTIGRREKCTTGHHRVNAGNTLMSKGNETRVRILEECARQAAARGLVGVSLNDIAEAVGLSKSGLFKHFESKEAMQYAVLEQ